MKKNLMEKTETSFVTFLSNSAGLGNVIQSLIFFVRSWYTLSTTPPKTGNDDDDDVPSLCFCVFSTSTQKIYYLIFNNRFF